MNIEQAARAENTPGLVHALFDLVPDDWDENDIGILADGLAEYLLSSENVEVM